MVTIRRDYNYHDTLASAADSGQEPWLGVVTWGKYDNEQFGGDR